MNPEHERLGLIIQGPLVSRGRTGKTGHIPFGSVSEGDVVDYDCIASIKDLLEQLPKHVFSVVATWSNQSEQAIRAIESLDGVNRVLILEEPKTGPARGDIVPGNNAFRQFWGTHQALMEIKNECDYVIKVRTDQTMEVARLLDEFRSMLAKDKNAFFVPQFRMNNPSLVGDFYFGSSVDVMQTALNELVASKSGLDDGRVHRHLFRAIAKAVHPHYSWFDSPWDYLSQKKLFETWSKIFLSSRELYLSVKWRGEKIPEHLLSKSFSFESGYPNTKQPTRSQVFTSLVSYSYNTARNLFR